MILDPYTDVIDACVDCDPGLMRALLDVGAAFNVRDGEGRPAWEVLFCGPETPAQVACFQVLLEGGMRMDRSSRKGFSLLWVMALEGRQGSAQALLARKGPKRVLARMEYDLQQASDARVWWEGQIAEHQAQAILTRTPTAPTRPGRPPRL